jgi:hypothetical protein
MPKVKGQLVEHTEGDEKLIRRLGRAVALQWAHLPAAVQKRILDQAWTVFDAEPVSAKLKAELQAFVEKHRLRRNLESYKPERPSGDRRA